jgi:hypothetical protein
VKEPRYKTRHLIGYTGYFKLIKHKHSQFRIGYMYINKIVISTFFFLIINLQYANKLAGQACVLFLFPFYFKTQNEKSTGVQSLSCRTNQDTGGGINPMDKALIYKARDLKFLTLPKELSSPIGAYVRVL